MLVDGFDGAPYIMMTYNPSYYRELAERHGFEKARDLHAYVVSSDQNAPERAMRILEKRGKKEKLLVRPVEIKKLKSELKALHTIFNACLKRNWGFVPVDLEDLELAANDLKDVLDPELVLVAEKEEPNGEKRTAGFSLMIPNINEFLVGTQKLPKWARFAKLAWKVVTKTRPQTSRLVILGVHPDYLAAGLGSRFYIDTLMKCRGRYKNAECSWIEESNQEIITALEMMGGKRTRTYRIFEKAL
jgi:GNAT superfamily N-acetyltransferase